MNTPTYEVSPRQSFLVPRSAGKDYTRPHLSAGDEVTSGIMQRIGRSEFERLLELGVIRERLVSRAPDFDVLDLEDKLHNVTLMGDVDPTQDLGEGDEEEDEPGSQDEQPSMDASGRLVSKGGPWNLDPHPLVGKPLPELIVMIQDIDPNAPRPSSVAQAVAMLSRDFDPHFRVAAPTARE